MKKVMESNLNAMKLYQQTAAAAAATVSEWHEFAKQKQ